MMGCDLVFQTATDARTLICKGSCFTYYGGETTSSNYLKQNMHEFNMLDK
jgi:hypothetical protein